MKTRALPDAPLRLCLSATGLWQPPCLRTCLDMANEWECKRRRVSGRRVHMWQELWCWCSQLQACLMMRPRNREV